MARTAHGERDGGTGSEMGCYVCLLVCTVFFREAVLLTCFLSCMERVPFYQGSIQCS